MPEFTIPKGSSAREVLKAINTWADDYKGLDKQPTALWSVLTAMRGPDSENGVVKERHTEVLRGYVLPRLADAGGALRDYGATEERLIDAGISAINARNLITNNSQHLQHFYSHFIWAVEALTGRELRKELAVWS